jgi:hypothetical protein
VAKSSNEGSSFTSVLEVASICALVVVCGVVACPCTSLGDIHTRVLIDATMCRDAAVRVVEVDVRVVKVDVEPAMPGRAANFA